MNERDKKSINRVIHHIGLIQSYMKAISSLNQFNQDSLIMKIST